jgi:predicted metal-dependent phosphoesterase TrpH
MIIDIHVHTSPRSKCSNIDPVEMIKEAARLGLDGVCLTEHQVLWSREEADDLASDSGIKVFRGNEITTNMGDVLVFGYWEHIEGIMPLKKLYRTVKSQGGFIAAAHPFRGFKMVGVSQLELKADQASERKVFKSVDAIEIRNGKLNEKENDLAGQVAEKLGLPGLAGSDAHNLDELGRFAMIFESDLTNDEDLTKELKANRFSLGTAR